MASDLCLSVTRSGLAPQIVDMYPTNLYPFQLSTGQPLNITASLAPALSDGNLTIEYRSTVLTSCGFCEPFSNWTSITSSAPSDGVLNVPWTPTVNGAYEVRALWGGDSTHESSRSTAFDVQVYSNPSAILTSTTEAVSLSTSSQTVNSFTTTFSTQSESNPITPVTHTTSAAFTSVTTAALQRFRTQATSATVWSSSYCNLCCWRCIRISSQKKEMNIH